MLGVCGGDCEADDDGDGICDYLQVEGCTDPAACNYDALAYIDIGTCQYIPEGACDCEGTMPGYGRDCGGNCILDEDNDGLCDDLDPCVPNQELNPTVYKMTVEEFNVGHWVPPTGSTSTQKIRRTDSAVFENDGSDDHFHPKGYTTTLIHLGMPLASMRHFSGSSQIWNSTATPPSVLRGPLQV